MKGGMEEGSSEEVILLAFRLRLCVGLDSPNGNLRHEELNVSKIEKGNHPFSCYPLRPCMEACKLNRQKTD